MSRRFLLACALPFLLGLAHARSAKPVAPEDEVVLSDQAQKRRDALRETLKAPVSERDSAADSRALSTQQKSEMRQQVRQQHMESRK